MRKKCGAPPIDNPSRNTLYARERAAKYRKDQAARDAVYQQYLLETFGVLTLQGETQKHKQRKVFREEKLKPHPKGIGKSNTRELDWNNPNVWRLD